MKLHEFLQGVKACPDELLSERYGIWDNFPILVSGMSVEEMILHLLASGKYETHSLENDIDGESRLKAFSHVPQETVRAIYARQLSWKEGLMVVNPRNDIGNIETYTNADDLGFVPIYEAQKTYFTAALMLHPYQKRRPDTSIRVITTVLEDIITNLLVPKSIPFCLPRVFHYKKGEKLQDYSTIVWWPDELEERMCRRPV